MNYDGGPFELEARDEMTIRDSVTVIRSKLEETKGTLNTILSSINNKKERMEEKRPGEANCMMDEMKIVDELANACMELSKMIQAMLF